MAAVAAEPGAAAVPTTTKTAATDEEGQPQPDPASPRLMASETESGEQREYGSALEVLAPRMDDGGDGEECRHVRPELDPAAGKALSDTAFTDQLVNTHTVDRVAMERFSPSVPGEPEGGGNVSVQAVYRSILADPQPSAVFLHSFPAPPAVTEAGLSLAEPAEPTTNVTTDRAETADADRCYTALLQPELSHSPKDAMLDRNVSNERLSVPDGLNTDTVYAPSPAGTEEQPGRNVRESSSPCRSPKRRPATDALKQEKPDADDSSVSDPTPAPGSGTLSPASVQDLSPGSDVRVSLDHVIDDALVVSFRLGEKVFSGVLMDISKRFGPYGIPITVFPRRDNRSRPQTSVPALPASSDNFPPKQEEVMAPSAASPLPPPSHPPAPSPPPPPSAPSHPWTSKPPPLFQEGAPYPPPLFIRDTYNQALPQPLPRKIKRPKRRYRCEEATSIMNSIKLRPRQVLCDKCKGVVASGGHRETRRGPVDLRGEEASRRRRAADGPIPAELKRLRNDDKGGRAAADKRSASGLRVAPPAASSGRVLRGVSSSSSSAVSSSGRMCLKKVLAKGSSSRSKAQQVLKKLTRSSQPSRSKDQNQNQNQHRQRDTRDCNKATTRAAALQTHNQKVHFTRRQHLNAAAAAHTPLPPRVRLKPQRYRTDDSQEPCSSSCTSSSLLPPKPAVRQSPPKSVLGPAPASTAVPCVSAAAPSSPPPLLEPLPSGKSWEEKQREEEVEEEVQQGGEGDRKQDAAPSPPPGSSSQESAHSEHSATETLDPLPHADLSCSSSSSSSSSTSSTSSSPPTSTLLPPSGPRRPSSSSSSASSTSSISAPPPPSPPAAPPANRGEEEEEEEEGAEEEEQEDEGADPKRRRKSPASSSVFSKPVTRCLLPDGRTVCVGDIVWAKIYGFPWWPARVLGITVARHGEAARASRQEARVSWFGSPTTSFLPLTQLSPFLESFQSRFDRKRKGPYRRAIAEAASAAKQLTPEVRALLTQFET